MQCSHPCTEDGASKQGESHEIEKLTQEKMCACVCTWHAHTCYGLRVTCWEIDRKEISGSSLETELTLATVEELARAGFMPVWCEEWALCRFGLEMTSVLLSAVSPGTAWNKGLSTGHIAAQRICFWKPRDNCMKASNAHALWPSNSIFKAIPKKSTFLCTWLIIYKVLHCCNKQPNILTIMNWVIYSIFYKGQLCVSKISWELSMIQ